MGKNAGLRRFSVVLVPKTMRHFEWAKTEVIVQIHGIEPFKIIPRRSLDLPGGSERSRAIQGGSERGEPVQIRAEGSSPVEKGRRRSAAWILFRQEPDHAV
jgi:hypothetical protein